MVIWGCQAANVLADSKPVDFTYDQALPRRPMVAIQEGGSPSYLSGASPTAFLTRFQETMA